jgi:hypothetical protein
MGRVYRFSLKLGWAEANKSWPIYDEYFQLIGGFTVSTNGNIECFVSGVGHPASLSISSKTPFYATPLCGKHGGYEKIIVSEHKLNNQSVEVIAEES